MPTIIEIINASKRYSHGEKEIHALRNISLSIETGDIYGIIGLSGAGKSTLIRALARLVTLTSGEILFHGNNINLLVGDELRQFRKTIGMIFQHFNLLGSRTVEDNIAYPLEITHVPLESRKGRIDELLSLVSLREKRDRYPPQLSGGEKQRVGIARALASRPDVLLCDEATSALDPKTTKEILHLLQNINKKLGVTIVLITHEMEVIQHICNKVAVIQNGEIVERGLVADVFADPQHPITKNFLQNASHEIPPEFFRHPSPNKKLLRLKFKGKAASEPIISDIIRTCHVDVNILLGWIDRFQDGIVGTLTVELTGTPEGIASALKHLQDKSVHCEAIENES